ncbi:MAG: RluA family pseudouridine synthase [Myxococcales bacterium]|nr:RluA family pseudouridine synthase [Myxococcales bacterium]
MRRRRRAGTEPSRALSVAALRPPPGCDPDAVVLTFRVSGDVAGMRLDRFIQRRIPRLSRTRAQAVIRECGYHADGRRRRSSDIVRSGEIVLLVRERFQEPDVPLTFDVVHDDGEILGLNKPAGLPIHRTASYHRHTLTYLLRERYGPGGFVPRVAHRLDRETSGLVLCGRSTFAERGLKTAFERRAVRKTYLAIVHGLPDTDTGEITVPMARAREGLHVLMETREDGLAAHTEYRVVARRAEHALLSLSPRTGRQHQLRVHLAAIGHPIVGDKLYGPERERPFLEVMEHGLTPDLVARLGHPRQALHALAAEVPHPRTGVVLRVEVPLAPDLASLWESLP